MHWSERFFLAYFGRHRAGAGEGARRRIFRAAAALGVSACLLTGCQQLRLWPIAASDASASAVPAVEFDAADVLSAQQLQGPGYAVGPRVPVMDHNLAFRIRTHYGTIPAHGRNMLDLRLYEVQCIEQVAQIRGVRQILDGAIGALGETVEGAETLLLDPIGSVERAPKGLKRMAKGVLDSASRRAGSPERRQLALSLGCDPETHNPVLSRMLDEIEIQRLIGSLPVQFIPYTGIFRLTANIKDEMASTPPHEINERLEKELAADGVVAPLRRAFCRDGHFTTAERLLFMKDYRRLEGAENREALIEFAVEGASEADALGAIEVCQAFAHLQASRRVVGFAGRGLPEAGLPALPSRSLLRALPIPGLQEKPYAPRRERPGLPVAVLRDGRHVICAPYDCIVRTKELEDAVRSYRADFPSQPTTLMCSGRVMPDAREILDVAGITILERARAASHGTVSPGL